jgi:hypothetical protein
MPLSRHDGIIEHNSEDADAVARADPDLAKQVIRGAVSLAEAVRVSGLVGMVGTVGGVVIESVTLDSGNVSGDEQPTNGTQEHRYFTMFDYIFAYQEST